MLTIGEWLHLFVVDFAAVLDKRVIREVTERKVAAGAT